MPPLMLIVQGYDQAPPASPGAALAIGNFDGVHRGHQALLKATLEEARKFAIPAGTVVFEPHPREFFQPDKPHFRLTPLPLKLRLLADLGLDVAVVLPFDGGLAGLPAEEFIARVLVEALGVRHVVIGHDFRFGKGRGGDAEVLQRAGAAHGFGVTIVAQVAEAGEVFSSSAVRAELAQGDVRTAAHMLGWWWRVSGRVIGGAKRGTGLGFPTANVPLAPGTGLGHGIYAVRVHAAGMHYWPPPISAHGPPSMMARPSWKSSCSNSTGTSMDTKSKWNSLISFVPTGALTTLRTCRRKWTRTARKRAKASPGRLFGH